MVYVHLIKTKTSLVAYEALNTFCDEYKCSKFNSVNYLIILQIYYSFKCAIHFLKNL